ncbi:MAG TPA: prolyl oligopeptidase family serine peptidase [Acidimicrobiia bacterium]|nr:prolyl oligopeptidase family serine peptidase [Acidimicrobiia bacterium]
MSRPRNFSNWAYWRLHLDRVVEADPCPLDRLDTELEPWRARVRARLDAMLGARPEAVAPATEIEEPVDCGSYTRARVVFDTEATMSVPAYLLIPHDRHDGPPGPAVLAIHGHGPGKALVCGLVEGGPGDDYAHALASLGYVVLAPDLRGFGERRDWMPDDKYHCDWDLVCATMAGINPLERNLWDLHGALDVLVAHPLVDPARVAAAGLSYGGTSTLFLAALDDRVRAAVVSGYLASWKAAHTVPWNMCGSQVMPGQLGAVEHLDVAALIAPRPLLVESGTEDMIFPVAAARATVESLRRVYRELGASDDALVHDVFDGDHQWHGAEVPAFLGRWL